MSVSVTMPRLGESVSEGTVTRWLKKEGDQVEADEPLLEVSTDKVDTEIPSPAAGVLKSIKVGEDETVEVGSELAVIDEGGGGGDTAKSDDAADAGQDDAPAEQPTDDEGGDQKQEPDEDADQGNAKDEAERTPETDGGDTGESAADADEREAVATDDQAGGRQRDDEQTDNKQSEPAEQKSEPAEADE